VREGKVSTYLEYFRSRARIARSTALNLIMLTISALSFISTQCDALGCVSKPQMALVITATGILATTVTLLVLGVLEASYDARLDQVKRELAKSQKDAV
jgi:hypothetical protein